MFKKLNGKAKEIIRDLSVLYIAYKRKDIPVMVKIMIITAIIYGLSPIDLVPDFIPVLGYLDDLIILPLLIYISIKIIPKNILEECREEAKEIIIDGKYKKWYYGVPVILIWVLIGMYILEKIL